MLSPPFFCWLFKGGACIRASVSSWVHSRSHAQLVKLFQKQIKPSLVLVERYFSVFPHAIYIYFSPIHILSLSFCLHIGDVRDYEAELALWSAARGSIDLCYSPSSALTSFLLIRNFGFLQSTASDPAKP